MSNLQSAGPLCQRLRADIAYQDPGTPNDFHAYCEVYLGGRWQVFDARFDQPRVGRIRICSGYDAVNCAFTTVYGQAQLSNFEVWSYQVDPGEVSIGDPIDLSKRLCGTPQIRYPQRDDLAPLSPSCRFRLPNRRWGGVFFAIEAMCGNVYSGRGVAGLTEAPDAPRRGAVSNRYLTLAKGPKRSTRTRPTEKITRRSLFCPSVLDLGGDSKTLPPVLARGLTLGGQGCAGTGLFFFVRHPYPTCG